MNTFLRRFKIKFGLWKLLLLVTLSGIPFAFLGRWLNERRHEAQYIQALIARGGTLIEMSDRRQPLPAGDRAYKITMISLNGTNVTDDDLKQLWMFSSVNSLDLSNTEISGSTLQQLCNLPFLRELYLSNTRIGDRDLTHLVQVPYLRTLTLDGTDVTDEGLRTLSGHNYLTTLKLNGTDVTDDGLKCLVAIDFLDKIDVRNTLVTTKGLSTFWASHRDHIERRLEELRRKDAVDH